MTPIKIYIVCPVRNVSVEQVEEISKYVNDLENEGHTVHYPPRDVDQDDPTGFEICTSHKKAMQDCDRVDVFWDKTSSGSHFDIGMAFALNKTIKIVKAYQPDNEGKSFLKVMKQLEIKEVDDMPCPNGQVCCDCGGTTDLSYAPDPYNEDINGNDEPVWECDSCRYNSAMDI